MRTRTAAGCLMAIMCLVAACSSAAAPAALSADAVAQALDDICHDADRDIERLDSGLDSDIESWAEEVSALTDDAIIEMQGLRAPQAAERDLNDLLDNLDEQVRLIEQIGRLDTADAVALAAYTTPMAELGDDADGLAADLAADDCIGFGAAATFQEQRDNPVNPVPDVTIPDVSGPDVSGPDVSGPDLTVPDFTITDDTIPGSGSTNALIGEAAEDLFVAPAGYTWLQLGDPTSLYTPGDDPILGPIVASYSNGSLVAADDTEIGVYVTVLAGGPSTDWTPEQVDAYISFELLNLGTPTTTPKGRPATVERGWLSDTDAGLTYVPGFGVSILAPTDFDVVTFLDAFADAQSWGG